MTFAEALAEAKRLSVAHCSDAALMAQFLEANAHGLIGAVSPRLVWEGAQKQRMTTQQLTELIHKDRRQAADLMWV